MHTEVLVVVMWVCSVWCPQLMTSQTCMNGYQLSEKYVCVDIDDCEGYGDPTYILLLCGAYTVCHNTLGSHYCTCRDGYVTPSGKTNFTTLTNCQDINECESTPCGSNATCHNTKGSFHCECDPGFVPSGGEASSHTTTTRCKENYLKDILNKLNLLVNNSLPLSDVVKLGDNIVSNRKHWEQIDRKDRASTASTFLDTMASSVMATFNASNGRVSETSQYIDIEWRAAPENVSLNDLLTLNRRDSTMSIFWRTMTAGNQSGRPAVGLIAYRNMETILDEYFDDEENEVSAKYQLNSEVVTITSNVNISELTEHFNMTLKHTKERYPNVEPRCFMWKHTSQRQGWSAVGCHVINSTENHTTVSCSQLASFAILMAPIDIEVGVALHIITQVGIIASLVCLAISIVTFLFGQTIQRETRTIHIHLSVSLFLAELLFVTGISWTRNKIWCAIIAGALHYLFLAAFTWMFLDGLQLFLLVRNLSKVKASRSITAREIGLYAFGYGLPAIIVGISAAMNPSGFGSSQFCWLQLHKGFIWSFLGPVVAIILINTILFIGTLWTLRQKISGLNSQVSKIKDKRMLAFKAAGQVFVLGCTWILGAFHFQKETVVMAYLFTIVNSFQGVFIFIFLCVLNKQVREEYRRCFSRVNKKMRSSYTMETVSPNMQLTGTSADGSGKQLEN